MSIFKLSIFRMVGDNMGCQICLSYILKIGDSDNIKCFMLETEDDMPREIIRDFIFIRPKVL